MSSKCMVISKQHLLNLMLSDVKSNIEMGNMNISSMFCLYVRTLTSILESFKDHKVASKCHEVVALNSVDNLTLAFCSIKRTVPFFGYKMQ